MFLNKILIILFFSISFISFSQKKDVKKDSVKTSVLDEVVITATRTIRQLSSLPMPVTLISKEQIQKSGTTRLKDILIEQTGINFVTDQSGFTGVQLQGLSAEYTLIMIDGVPLVGRSSGNLDLSRITVNNIKQIEIVKGASSSLYGSEALGGVINIITEKPKRDIIKGDIGYFARIGARDELDINTNLIYKKGKIGTVAGFNLNSSRGFDLSPSTASKTTEEYQNYTGNLKLTYDFSKNLNLFVSQRYFYEEQGEDSSQSDWNSNIEFRHQINNIYDVNYTFYTTQFITESQFNGELSEFNQTLTRPEIRITTAIEKSTLVIGLGANFDALDRTFFDKKERFNSKYIFAQYDFYPIENMNLILGARYDNHNKYKSAFSPKISSSYKIYDWLTTKLSIGFGFKAPDFRQLFFNFNNRSGGYIVLGTRTLHDLYGNEPNVQSIDKDLKPENSIGYNAGFNMKVNSDLKININFFRNDINDLINTATLKGSLPGISTGTSIFYYENRNQVSTQGIELDFTYKISDNIRFVGGYQFLDSKDKQEIKNIETGTVFFRQTPSSPSKILEKSDYFGLPNRSKHTANAKLFYQNFTHDFSANIRTFYRSKYALFDTNSSQNIIDKYDDFVVGNAQINAAIEKTFFNLINVQLGVDNLFNNQGLVNESVFTNNDAVLLVGRNYYSRVRFNF